MGPRLRSRGIIGTGCPVCGSQYDASMGPRLRSRGIPYTIAATPMRTGCFNGAAASQPRNLVTQEAKASGGGMLQWGRGFAAAESIEKRTIPQADLELQWGRGFAAAESSPWTPKRRAACALQWGRGFAAAESAAILTVQFSRIYGGSCERSPQLSESSSSSTGSKAQMPCHPVTCQLASAPRQFRVTSPLAGHNAGSHRLRTTRYRVSNPGYAATSPVVYRASSRAWISSTRR